MGRLEYILKFGILLLLTTTGLVSCETEGTINPSYKDYFIKYYGGDGNQVASDFIVNEDGTIVMVGTWQETNNNTRIYIVKADSEGNVIWSRKLGETRENVRDIDVFRSGTYEGQYMILSNLKHVDSDSTDVKVLVVNANGNPVDSILFNEYFTQFGHSITALSDGGFAIAGNADTLALLDENIVNGTFAKDEKDNLSLRYDKDLVSFGDLWKPSFGKETYAMAVKIFERSPGDFAYAAYTNALQPTVFDPDTGEEREDVLNDQNFYFSKLLPFSGDVDGQGFYAGNPGPRLNEQLAGIARSPSGLYLSVGTQVDASDRKIYAAVINSTFTKPPSTSPMPEGPVDASDGNSEGISVAPSATSNVFWILGNKYRIGGRDIWIGRLNINASVNPGFSTDFSATFGAANNDDTGSAIAELANGDVVILATMELVNQKKMALIKVRPNGGF